MRAVKRKVLFCATIDIHFMKFHLPYLKWFKEQGWEVHVAAFGNLDIPFTDQKFHINIQRSPLNKMNIAAYHELKTIIDINSYSIIHCHTPMGGVLARLASRTIRKSGAKVIYTAHGFHFCKGSPLINWLLYYPVEKILSKYTDCLITINNEDYNLAANHCFKTAYIEQIHGVGVDIERFKPLNPIQKNEMRLAAGYTPNDFLMFYAAEFNENKNHSLLIESMNLVKHEIPNAKLILAGDGPLLKYCQRLAKSKKIDHMIDFLGYKNTIEGYLKLADLAVASSRREGLPVNVMEAMASSLPVLATMNRGHKELIQHEQNGYLVPLEDAVLYSKRMVQLYQSRALREQMGAVSLNKIRDYSIDRVSLELKQIYSRYMADPVLHTSTAKEAVQ